MRRHIHHQTILLTATLAAFSTLGCGGKSSAHPQDQQACVGSACTPVTLQSVSVTPASSAIAKGTVQQLAATALYSDGSEVNVSASASWSTSDASILALGASGDASVDAMGVSSGTAQIAATLAGVTGSATVQVTTAVARSLAVEPATATIASGTTRQLTAIAAFSDGSTQDVTGAADWTSSDEGVATVTTLAGGGLVTANAAGPATVSASYSGLTSASAITVVAQRVLTTILVTPAMPSIPLGVDQQLTATGIYSDMSQADITADVTWTALTATVASVSATGLVRPLVSGSTVVTASLGGATGETTVTVPPATVTLDSIDVLPGTVSVAKGTDVPFTATGNFSDGSSHDLTGTVTWTATSDPAVDPPVVTFSTAAGSAGLATATAEGSATVTATLADAGVSGTATITVTPAVLQSIAITPATISIPKGLQQQLSARGTFSDGTTQDLTAQAEWSSDTTSVASVSNAALSKGLVSAVDKGDATVTATVTVGQVVASASSAVTVTDAVIRSIAMTPATASVPAGIQVQFKATGTYSDGSTHDVTADATWQSSDATVATVSTVDPTRGLATSVAVGTASISATLDGVVWGHATLTVANAVLSSISIVPGSFNVAHGATQSLRAMGTFTNGTVIDMTTQCVWSSSSKSVAWVSKKGVVTGVKPGPVVITAKKGSKKGTATGTVQ